jgi:hypothetical protein
MRAVFPARIARSTRFFVENFVCSKCTEAFSHGNEKGTNREGKTMEVMRLQQISAGGILSWLKHSVVFKRVASVIRHNKMIQ